MHAEIMAYLHRYTPVHLHNLLDDPQVTFEVLQLDADLFGDPTRGQTLGI